MKRILVTGGAGFLGSHLVEWLALEGHHVIALDNFFTGRRENIVAAGVEVVRADVCDPMHFEVDQIYHMACPASPIHYQRNPVRTIKTCVQGTLHALELARETGARLLIASTSEVYGDPEVHPQPEIYWGHANPIGPRACYDEGKRCAEALAASFAAQFETQVRIARIFNCYGPRMAPDDGRVVSNFIVQALRGDSLTVYGDGKQTRSFIYVDDLVDGLVRLMNSTANINAMPINLGNPVEFTIGELAQMVGHMVQQTGIDRRALPVDDPTRRKPDITRARQLLDWQPKTQLEEGLARTVDYFRTLLTR